MRRLFLTIGVLLALVIGVVPAFADNGTNKAPATGRAPGIELSCPRSNSTPNDDRFNTIWGDDLFVLQRAVRGNIQVNVDFDNRSPAAYVRLHNTETNTDSEWKYFNTTNAVQSFNVNCGSWMVQIKSANFYYTVGRLSGSVQ